MAGVRVGRWGGSEKGGEGWGEQVRKGMNKSSNRYGRMW